MFEYQFISHLFLVVILDSWHAKEEEKDEKEEKLEMEPGGKESSNHKLSLRSWNFEIEILYRMEKKIADSVGNQNLIFPSNLKQTRFEEVSFLALV